MFGKNFKLFIWFYLLAILLIGGINWLVTAIRSLKDSNDEVKDLLNLIGLPQIISNLFYIYVFICSIIVLIWAIYYQIKKK